jgi:hypothetical protein
MLPVQQAYPRCCVASSLLLLLLILLLALPLLILLPHLRPQAINSFLQAAGLASTDVLQNEALCDVSVGRGCMSATTKHQVAPGPVVSQGCAGMPCKGLWLGALHSGMPLCAAMVLGHASCYRHV